MLVGGWLADRTSPRRILLVANVLRAILAGLLAIVVASGAAELPVLALLGFMFGTVDAFFLPAVNAAVPLLVDGGRLGSANAWLQGTAQVAALMGPALAGGLVSASGAGPAFAINSASFVFAALAVRSIPAHAVRAHDGGSDGRGGFLEGLRYARLDVPVAIITVLATLFSLRSLDRWRSACRGLASADSAGPPRSASCWPPGPAAHWSARSSLPSSTLWNGRAA